MEAVDWGVRALQGRATRVSAEEAHADDPADDEEYKAFAHGRVGTRPQRTVLFRKCDGEEEGFAYAQFSRIRTTDRGREFTVEFAGVQVKVEGRNLGKLFAFLCAQRVPEIVEAARATALSLPDSEAVVESIRFLKGPVR